MPVSDVSEFLAELEPRATRHALRLRVAYHDACHLQHSQGVRTQPRALLERIPQLQLLEIPEAAICCGSAGIYCPPARGAKAAGSRHIVELLDASIRGISM